VIEKLFIKIQDINIQSSFELDDLSPFEVDGLSPFELYELSPFMPDGLSPPDDFFFILNFEISFS
jgi:hypothetical protein